MSASHSPSNSGFANLIVRAWDKNAAWLYVLLPLSLLYRLLIVIRRGLYRAGIFASPKLPVPIIIVGNITVGGTGKTPTVVALVKSLKQAGYKPGIVSRGYGSDAPEYPYLVTPNSPPKYSGDEPLLMAIRTAAPVMIGANRVQAASHLIKLQGCDVLVSDDGLQHYSLQRDIEIVVVDGQRQFANRQLLPVGPLREPVSRLNEVDHIVFNGQPSATRSSASVHQMMLQPADLYLLDNSHSEAASDWGHSRRVHAVAGIGNPDRFFNTLKQLGFEPIPHSFLDHHQFSTTDLLFDDNLPVIMTEKDAVKVRAINAPKNCWYLPVEADIDGGLFDKVIQQLPHLPARQ